MPMVYHMPQLYVHSLVWKFPWQCSTIPPKIPFPNKLSLDNLSLTFLKFRLTTVQELGWSAWIGSKQSLQAMKNYSAEWLVNLFRQLFSKLQNSRYSIQILLPHSKVVYLEKGWNCPERQILSVRKHKWFMFSQCWTEHRGLSLKEQTK